MNALGCCLPLLKIFLHRPSMRVFSYLAVDLHMTLNHHQGTASPCGWSKRGGSKDSGQVHPAKKLKLAGGKPTDSGKVDFSNHTLSPNTVLLFLR